VLDPQSPIPLYHQLSELLRARISDGQLPPGSRLPSEVELSRTYRIGRPTVRQAMDRLVQGKLVERRRGSGTYVLQPPRPVDLFSLGGTLASFERSGVELQTRLLGRVARRRVEDDSESPFFGREAFTFARLGRTQRGPVLVERVALDPSVFPNFNRIPLAGVSLSRIIREHFHLSPGCAEQTFRVASPEGEIRAALELESNDFILLVKRRLVFPSLGPAIYCQLHCRTDEFVFSQSIEVKSFS
jgi:GntR family transcriptional regulator